MEDRKGKYGLILPNKGKKILGVPVLSAESRKRTAANVFGDDSDLEEDSSNVDWVQKTLLKQSAQGSIQQRQAAQVIKKALKDDPTVYQYDELYDDMEQTRELSKKDSRKDKKPKYIDKLLLTAAGRQKEFEARLERDVQKEREAEGDMYKDKEAFVTGAYRKKMEELEKAKEEEARKDAIDNLTDVTKQKDLSGFYRHLYKQTLGSEKESIVASKPDSDPITESSPNEKARKDAIDDLYDDTKQKESSVSSRHPYKHRYDDIKQKDSSDTSRNPNKNRSDDTKQKDSSDTSRNPNKNRSDDTKQKDSSDTSRNPNKNRSDDTKQKDSSDISRNPNKNRSDDTKQKDSSDISRNPNKNRSDDTKQKDSSDTSRRPYKNRSDDTKRDSSETSRHSYKHRFDGTQQKDSSGSSIHAYKQVPDPDVICQSSPKEKSRKYAIDSRSDVDRERDSSRSSRHSYKQNFTPEKNPVVTSNPENPNARVILQYNQKDKLPQSLTNKLQELDKNVPEISSIWGKRTVDKAFDDALKRYLERKESNTFQAAIVHTK